MIKKGEIKVDGGKKKTETDGFTGSWTQETSKFFS